MAKMNPYQRRIRALMFLGEDHPGLAQLLTVTSAVVPTGTFFAVMSLTAPVAIRISLGVVAGLVVAFVMGRLEHRVIRWAKVDLSPRMRDWTKDEHPRT